MDLSHFIYLFIRDGRLGRFQLLAVRVNAAIDVCVQTTYTLALVSSAQRTTALEVGHD